MNKKIYFSIFFLLFIIALPLQHTQAQEEQFIENDLKPISGCLRYNVTNTHPMVNTWTFITIGKDNTFIEGMKTDQGGVFKGKWKYWIGEKINVNFQLENDTKITFHKIEILMPKNPESTYHVLGTFYISPKSYKPPYGAYSYYGEDWKGFVVMIGIVLVIFIPIFIDVERRKKGIEKK